MLKKISLVIMSFALLLGATACTDSDADVAGQNLSKAAEQFEIPRRIVFINGITDKYLLSVEGRCSVETTDSGLDGSLSVVCLTHDDEDNDKDEYKKHYLGLSDNVTYMVEQLDGENVSTNHYRVIFKPEVIIPDIDRP